MAYGKGMTVMQIARNKKRPRAASTVQNIAKTAAEKLGARSTQKFRVIAARYVLAQELFKNGKGKCHE
ncbi:MAG: hypothetical protein H0U18_03430 [Pyrinomonadaceae bacterium]|nr:hypothetical protein [Pyrinomonadaceae bacterium]